MQAIMARVGTVRITAITVKDGRGIELRARQIGCDRHPQRQGELKQKGE